MSTNPNKPKQTAPKNPDASMSILEHLGELRQRLLRSCIVLFVCVLVAYVFRQELLDTFKAPVMEPLQKYSAQVATLSNVPQTPAPALPADTTDLAIPDHRYSCNCTAISIPLEAAKDQRQQEVRPELDCHCIPRADALGEDTAKKEISPARQEVSNTPNPNSSGQAGALVFLALPELFFSQLKIAFFAGLFLAFPYLLIELWGFVGPALYRNERKVFWTFASFTVICFIGGALFGYFVVFPFGFEFFLSLTQPGEIVPSLSIGAYLSFALKLLFAFGIVFELPPVVLILSRLGVITPQWMLKNSKYAILGFFVLAAILTPPDPFTMLLMAGPLIVLYYFSVLVSYLAAGKLSEAADQS